MLMSATMMETNDNPPKNVRVALTSTVGQNTTSTILHKLIFHYDDSVHNPPTLIPSES
jgi:hypothetical protein